MTCTSHLLDLITLTILGEQYKLWSSSLWSLLHPSWVLLLNTLSKILLMRTHCMALVEKNTMNYLNMITNLFSLQMLQHVDNAAAWQWKERLRAFSQPVAFISCRSLKEKERWGRHLYVWWKPQVGWKLPVFMFSQKSFDSTHKSTDMSQIGVKLFFYF